MAPRTNTAPRLLIAQRLQQIAYEFSGQNIPHWDTLSGRAQQEWAKKADGIIQIAKRHVDVETGSGCVLCDLEIPATRQGDKFFHRLTNRRMLECNKLVVKG